MKIIELTRGMKATVDDDDYDWLIKYKWRAHFAGKKIYAVRGGRPMFYMHREIMEKRGKTGLIEHDDGDGTNNQKGNLLESTHSRNHLNREETVGVTILPERAKRRYAAKLVVNGEIVFWKSFETFEEAKEAYEKEKWAFL